MKKNVILCIIGIIFLTGFLIEWKTMLYLLAVLLIAFITLSAICVRWFFLNWGKEDENEKFYQEDLAALEK